MHKLHRNKPSTSVYAHTRACMQAYTHTDAHACKRTHAHKPACKRVIQTYTRICTIRIETKSTNSTNTACTVRSICTYGERMYMTLKCSVRSARMAQAHPFLRCYMHPQRIPAFWENTCPEKTRKDRVSLATPKRTPVTPSTSAPSLSRCPQRRASSARRFQQSLYDTLRTKTFHALM